MLLTHKEAKVNPFKKLFMAIKDVIILKLVNSNLGARKSNLEIMFLTFVGITCH